MAALTTLFFYLAISKGADEAWAVPALVVMVFATVALPMFVHSDIAYDHKLDGIDGPPENAKGRMP